MADKVSIPSFNDANFHRICDELGSRDADLRAITLRFGYPPLWRRANSFETLVHLVLEQQVSLASALAAMNKLKIKVGEVTAHSIASLTEQELKDCYFSRQKAGYVKQLSEAVLHGALDLACLGGWPDDAVRSTLTKIKGIGNWTADVYLMMVLGRCDVFPVGDVALLTSIRETKNLPAGTEKALMMEIAASWQPYRTIAAFMLWHSYLCKRKR